MKEGCYFTLIDNNGELIWTSEHIIGNSPDTSYRYWRNIYPVNFHNQMQGKVYIGQFTDKIYTPNDMLFKEEVYTYILISLLASLLILLPFFHLLIDCPD